MPMKKDLAALPSEAPQPPLRRGRGLRLSRASKHALERAEKPSAAPEPAAQIESFAAPIAPDPETSELDAIAATPIEVAVPSALAPPAPERDKRKLLLRKDLLKRCKRLARAQDRKLYQVVEAALEEYLQRHGATE